MKKMNNSWRNFLNENSRAENVPFKDTRIRIKLENKQNLLREVTYDEFDHIEKAIDELSYDDLAFQEIFGDRSRIVIDFPSLDQNSELGKFVNLLQNDFGLEADWNKGMISVEREWEDHIGATERIAQFMGPPGRVGFGTSKKIKKKLQMKIGKYLTKVDDLINQLSDLKVEVAKKVHAGHANPLSAARLANIDMRTARVTIGEMEEHLTEKENQRYEQLQNQLSLLTGRSLLGEFRNYFLSDKEKYAWKEQERARREQQDKADIEHNKKPRTRQPIIVPETRFVDWGKYWLKNAKYIKENIDSVESDQYSIIITRDPIDVWRMSDFEHISSCHSPPSRGGGGEYYKCAVAEAHGHGALAYVVKTEDLLHDTNTSNIDSAEQEIQKGEIFHDDERNADSGYLTPVSRLRVRKFRYYDTRTPVRWDEGTQVASVERRVYGAQIPGFQDRMIDWLRKNQKEQMEKAPMVGDGSILNLSHFVQFGGTQYDTPLSFQLVDLFGNQIEGTEGHVQQNSETEDDLDNELLLGGLIQQYQTECDNISDRYNNKFRSTDVTGTAVDDGGGGVYITCEAKLYIYWNADDFTKMPGVEMISHGLQELEGSWGINWPDSDYPYIFEKMSNRWKLPITVNPEKLVGFDGQEYAYAPDNYEEFCIAVDEEVDDMDGAVEQALTKFFQREGYMAGGAAMVLGREVMYDEMGLYHWESEAEESNEPDEFEFVQFTAHPEVWYKDLGASEEQAMQIMNDRIFWLEIRRRMAAPAFEATGGAMYPQMPLDMDLFGEDGTEGESQELNLYFSIYGEDPDEQVNVLKELVNIWDDQDEIDRVASEVFRDIFQKKVNMTGTPVGDLREELSTLKIDRLLRRLNEIEETADADLDKWLADNNINLKDVVTKNDTISMESHKEEIDSYVSQVESGPNKGDVQEDIWKKLCDEGINKPVIIDQTGVKELVVGGANRFVAAQKCLTNIALPIIYISRKNE